MDTTNDNNDNKVGRARARRRAAQQSLALNFEAQAYGSAAYGYDGRGSSEPARRKSRRSTVGRVTGVAVLVGAAVAVSLGRNLEPLLPAVNPGGGAGLVAAQADDGDDATADAGPTTLPTVSPAIVKALANMPVSIAAADVVDATAAPVVAVAQTTNAAGAPATDAPAAAPADPSAAHADVPAPFFTSGVGPDGHVSMDLNKVRVLATTHRIKKADPLTPDVADVVILSPNELLVTGKKTGATQLVLWDETDKSSVVDVTVAADLDALKKQLAATFPDAKIDAAQANDQISLTGHAPSLQIAEQAQQLAAPYASKVLNLIEVSGGQQVMLQVKFAEVSKEATNSLGVNLGYTDGHSFAGSNVGGINSFGTKDLPSGLGQQLTSIDPSTSAATLFAQSAIGQTTLQTFIEALRENNLLRVLAEPNLIAISGQEASFLAGGEFPLPVPQGVSGAVTVEFKQYGIKLNFTPIVLGNGHIRLKCSPEVSDLDYSTAIKFSGYVIPGLISRKINTTVELGEGQTFALAGLLSQNVAANASSVPGLGDIPVLGALFRSVRYQRKETELVVLVTPRLVDGLNPSQVGDVPGEHWRHPTDADLFFRRDLGGDADDHRHGPSTRPSAMNAAASGDGPADRGPAAPYRGEYGFRPARKAQDAAATADSGN